MRYDAFAQILASAHHGQAQAAPAPCSSTVGRQIARIVGQLMARGAAALATLAKALAPVENPA